EGGVHFAREQVQNTADGAGRAAGVNGSEHQVPGFGRVNGRHKRFLVAHFADQHDVGIFADRVLHADAEIDHVGAGFALIDQALVFGEGEFDRVFQRKNVLAVMVVDVVEHRGDGGAFAGTGHTGQQHHALIELTQIFHDRGQIQTIKIGNPVVHAASHHA